MSEESISEGSPAMNSTETIEKESLKIQAVIQAEVDDENQELHCTLHEAPRGFELACQRHDNSIASELIHMGRYRR